MSDSRRQRIYLDYAASTPLDPRVLKAMRPYLSGEFGNPGSLHSFGQAALAAVDSARAIIADALGADFREIVFTGSATEANNLILRGAVRAFRKAHPDRLPRIIVSAIEHESVLETARALEAEGAAELAIVPVDRSGIVRVDALAAALTDNTAIVSVMYVNNETGAIQPLAKIAACIAAFRGSAQTAAAALGSTVNIARPWPLFHSDAAQALQLLPCLPEELGLDAMTLSGHKIYGPKGIGALYIKNALSGTAARASAQSLPPLPPLITGGGQEFGLRSGTENVAAIAGFGKAVKLAVAEREARRKYITARRDAFLDGLRKLQPKLRINGGALRSPHILNVWLPGYAAEDLLIRLDLLGVAISSGSACRSRSFETSHVLQAMGLSAKRVRESVRISFGSTSAAEVRAALRGFKKILS